MELSPEIVSKISAHFTNLGINHCFECEAPGLAICPVIHVRVGFVDGELCNVTNVISLYCGNCGLERNYNALFSGLFCLAPNAVDLIWNEDLEPSEEDKTPPQKPSHLTLVVDNSEKTINGDYGKINLENNKKGITDERG